MYWTEANRDYIGKATMMGDSVEKIVATKVYQPFSITIAGKLSAYLLVALSVSLRFDYNTWLMGVDSWGGFFVDLYVFNSLKHCKEV